MGKGALAIPAGKRGKSTGRNQKSKPVSSAGRATGDLRIRNRALVLETLRAQGPISRGELAKAVSLSSPTVLDIVDELTSAELIRGNGVGQSTGGRRPALLELVQRAHCALGLAVGTRTLTAVLTDLHGQVVLRRDMDSGMNQGPATLLERVDEILREMLAALPQDIGSPLGIGLAVPAPITASTETVFSLPTYSEWGRLKLGEHIAAEYDLPVLVDNAANAAALGEHLFGAGQGCGSMFYILMHRGIGGAAVINGGVYRGAEGGAGEVGHMRLELDGPQCGCGNYGCLEAFVGRVAIRHRAVRLFKLFGRTEVGSKALEEIRAQDVIDAGLEGDRLAQEVLRETGRYLGIGVLNVMHLFNPELMIVGGSTTRAGDLILAPALEIVQRQVLPSVTKEARVVPGQLGEDAVAVGAAALALRELFDGSSSQEGELVG